MERENLFLELPLTVQPRETRSMYSDAGPSNQAFTSDGVGAGETSE